MGRTWVFLQGLLIVRFFLFSTVYRLISKLRFKRGSKEMASVGRCPLMLVLLYATFGSMMILGGHGRYHHHQIMSKHKHSHHASQISFPPSLPPGPEASAGPWPSPDNSANYDVRMFGAIGDGVADDTEAFKTAWNAACQTDSRVLLVPQGYTFVIQSSIFTGPCHGAFVLQVDGTIMAPDGPESWPASYSRRQWLVFYRVNGMSLQGGGLIDGKGEQWWNLPCKPHKGSTGSTMGEPCDSPIAIRFFVCTNITVHGIKIRNSPQFHFRFDECRNVRIESIQISSPSLSPNTDGIHIENTKNVGIYNSIISNGDDCVSIGSGCHDVDIGNVTCGPSHGISIGSLGNHNTRACASNITIRDSTIRNSDNGVRIKTWQGGSGSVSGVRFENIHMDNVRNPMIIDQFYCPGSSRDTMRCMNQSSAVYVSGIEYRGIKGTYDVRSPPMQFRCSDWIPCTNITIWDVELLPAKGQMVSEPFCWNAYGEQQTLTIPPVWCLLDGTPTFLQENDHLGLC